MNSHHSLIFTHQPWFKTAFDEADGGTEGGEGAGGGAGEGVGGVSGAAAERLKCTSVPKKRRMRLLKRFRENNVTALFCGGQLQSDQVGGGVLA
jgi:hypothetical protein